MRGGGEGREKWGGWRKNKKRRGDKMGENERGEEKREIGGERHN